MSVQSQYRNLHHLSFWEMAVSHLALWEVEESLNCWRNLHKESTVRTTILLSGLPFPKLTCLFLFLRVS
jgi:hypothetical protein